MHTVEGPSHESGFVVLRYACVLTATPVFVLFFGGVSFSECFCTIITVFSLYCMESMSHGFPFRMVFSYLVTTGWSFDIITRRLV